MRLIPILLLMLIFNACADQTAKKQTPAPDEHAAHQAAAPSGDYAALVNKGEIKEDTMKGSPKRVAMANVGATHIHIRYGSPGVKGRIIWGGLVPYDQVWVSGAHSATSIQINQPILINNKKIAPGTYGFFTIPGKQSWQLILNKNYQQHLTDQYKQEEDLVRITVNPEALPQPVPRLTYEVEKTSDSTGAVVLKWEQVQVKLPFLNEQ